MAGHQRNISSLIWRPILVTLIITLRDRALFYSSAHFYEYVIVDVSLDAEVPTKWNGRHPDTDLDLNSS